MSGVVTGLDQAAIDLDEVLFGKYRITRMIGRGGMGSVWEGVHLTLGNRVAVKFIDSSFTESPEALQRFENEARAAARLNSKYAVKVYDYGMTRGGLPCIVMEFLVGEPLDARVDRDGRIAPAETAQIISQVCRALGRAHSAGIVHRDLKPENIFLVWDEEDNAIVAKVVDFGIAKFTDNQAGISSSTRTGSVLGTPYYMSPEQARGLRTLDYRTDLWSLGVIAYRCIVGRLPFEGESIGDLLVKICTYPLPVPSAVAPGCPPGFDAWFARALQREPSERFTTAQELAEQLVIACVGGVGRQQLPSGQFGNVGLDTPAGPDPFGQLAPGAGVAAATSPQAARTDTVFSSSTVTQGQKKRTKLLVAGGMVAIVGVGGLAALLVTGQKATDGKTTGRDVVIAATAALGVPSAIPPTDAPIRTMDPSGVRATSPIPVSPSPSITPQPPSGVTNPAATTPTPSSSSTKAQPHRVQPAVARPPAPQAVPSAPPVRRPPVSRPIDVGY
jgi:eukaryotic-like serine/threonine-protein kinase